RARGRPDELGLLQTLRESGGAGVDDLVRLSDLYAASQQNNDAAEMLADALEQHVRDLETRSLPLDERGRTLMADLSSAAALSGAHGGRVGGLSRAAETEGDRAPASSTFAEAALLCRTQLGDLTTAADLLERALVRRPSSALLVADFEAVMRQLDD